MQQRKTPSSGAGGGEMTKEPWNSRRSELVAEATHDGLHLKCLRRVEWKRTTRRYRCVVHTAVELGEVILHAQDDIVGQTVFDAATNRGAKQSLTLVGGSRTGGRNKHAHNACRTTRLGVEQHVIDRVAQACSQRFEIAELRRHRVDEARDYFRVAQARPVAGDFDPHNPVLVLAVEADLAAR